MPTQLVEKYRPKTLGGFVGMDRARAILAKLAEEPYSSAWLLCGPSGLGKTTMALALAEQIGGQVHHIPSRSCNLQTVEEVIHHCHYAPFAGEWNFVVVDEADQMSMPAQLAFLSKLDTTAAPPQTIFFFTANSTAKLESRFLSRCRTIKFTTGGLLEPLVGLLKDIWAAEAPADVEAPDFARIAQDARLNVREAIMNLELAILAPRAEPEPVSEAAAAAPRSSAAKPARPAKAGADPRLPPPGTILVREFQNRRIAVQVLAQGFQFENREYGSLSAIAREVTKGNRNGYTFFGLGLNEASA